MITEIEKSFNKVRKFLEILKSSGLYILDL